MTHLIRNEDLVKFSYLKRKKEKRVQWMDPGGCRDFRDSSEKEGGGSGQLDLIDGWISYKAIG